MKTKELQINVMMIVTFLPIRSANHPQNKLPIICPRKNNDTSKELYVLTPASSSYHSFTTQIQYMFLVGSKYEWNVGW